MTVVKDVERPRSFELVHDDLRRPKYRFTVRDNEVDVIVDKWHTGTRSWDLTVYAGVPISEARMLWRHLTKRGYEEF